MYAIVADSGQQFRVEEGQELRIDFRDGANKGDEVVFDRVLMVSGNDGVKVGKPVVDGASVKAEVVGIKHGDKLVVQKFRRRKNSRRKTGHRQVYTMVRINSIDAVS
jgi:large subunit ribosomal protein L21